MQISVLRRVDKSHPSRYLCLLGSQRCNMSHGGSEGPNSVVVYDSSSELVGENKQPVELAPLQRTPS